MRRLCFTSILLVFILCACASSPSGPKGSVRIGAMKGATTIGLVGFIEEAASNVNFEIVAPAEIVPLLVRGELDMAAIPANQAAALYNSTNGGVCVIAINTLGLTYILETGNEIQTIQNLRGKTIVATGKSTPAEITLRHILKENGIDPDKDLTLEFKSEPAEAVAYLKQNGGVAMLPQPFATTAMDNVEGLREVLDLTAEWEKLGSSGTLVIGVFVARAEFLEVNPDDVAYIIEQYKKSVSWVNENPAEAAPLVEKHGIAQADVAERAIPKCNVTYIGGAEMKQMLEAYLNVLYESDPKSVGGALPGDDFYHVR
ncbi:MAG: ABC transporter substrate-binding protein [Oscillospiraceae bacterium]|nr:ABC transporter substrate-binding protein [Oscillospiraceae bacterium]